MHLSDVARSRPNAPAVVMSGSGRALTYAQLDAASRHFAAFLAERELNAGDTVAILMENSVAYIVAALAAQRRGLYFVPVNWHLTRNEIEFLITDSAAKTLITSPTMAELADAASAGVPTVEHLVVLADGADGGRTAAMEVSAMDVTPVAEPAGEEPNGIYMFYSSGTTGRPRGIKPSLPGTAFGDGLSVEKTLSEAFGFGPSARYLSTGPLYHAAALGWSLGTIALGGTAVIMERFDATMSLRAIESYGITHAQFVPTMFVRMLKLPDDVRKAHDLSSLRWAIHAAAPCPVDVKRQMFDWLGPVIYEFYGASEGICFFAIGPQEWLEHPGSVGRALRGVPHILDENGVDLPPGEIGEIWVDTPVVFDYHNDAVKTASVVNGKGWRTVGDMGSLDGGGYLYLADRRTDLIISGGVNIYPREIEEAMVMHPDVADVAVIGVPDDDLGQRVVAVVQLRDPAADSHQVRESLFNHLADRLARFKLPKDIQFMAELPRLPTGKILRRELRDLWK